MDAVRLHDIQTPEVFIARLEKVKAANPFMERVVVEYARDHIYMAEQHAVTVLLAKEFNQNLSYSSALQKLTSIKGRYLDIDAGKLDTQEIAKLVVAANEAASI